MTDDLVKRLRGDWFGYDVPLKAIDAMDEAADRIEQLQAQNLKLSGMCYDLKKKQGQLVDALTDLTELMERVRSGDYTPDGCTCNQAYDAMNGVPL